MTNVNDIVQAQIDAAVRKRQAREQQRTELGAARQHGLTARHRAKLARTRTPQQQGASIALAALSGDTTTIATLLNYTERDTGNRAAALALGALAELARTARPVNITKACDALRRIEAGVGESES
ncbi:hypothetical protein [Streptomyces sp. NPDC005283]|uniref:hypothetical protein n=1 Tax=Streptomyces sp. NPDC005283 TaxID=3156871 RepID=UPI003456B89B